MNTRRISALLALVVPAVALAQAAAATWRDSSSGLTWQNPPATSAADDMMSWADGKAYCDHLTLGGVSDWRLPTVDELRSLVRGSSDTEASGACGVRAGCLGNDCRDDRCDGSDTGGATCRWPDGLVGPCRPYWTASANSSEGGRAWLVLFYDGSVHDGAMSDYNTVRCVSSSAASN